jgi:uncharacterized membrane-anchored protein YitT (DUF2179 family)
MNERTVNAIKDILSDIIGAALVAAALVIFTVPNNIAPGGVSGLATALHHITPITIGMWSLILNVPLFIAAFRRLGFRPLLNTLVTTLLLSLFIDWFNTFLPGYINNVLVAAMFGGVIMGVGMGILLVRGSSTGGTDLLSLLMSGRLPDVPIGTLLMFIDGSVVVFAVLIFKNIDVAMYSAITIFISSKTVDYIMQGADYAKVIYVITDKGNELSSILQAGTDRGVTLIPAVGGYTGNDKTMLTTVVRRNNVSHALGLIKQCDPAAFVYVVNSTEVHGEGFKA